MTKWAMLRSLEVGDSFQIGFSRRKAHLWSMAVSSLQSADEAKDNFDYRFSVKRDRDGCYWVQRLEPYPIAKS